MYSVVFKMGKITVLPQRLIIVNKNYFKILPFKDSVEHDKWLTWLVKAEREFNGKRV